MFVTPELATDRKCPLRAATKQEAPPLCHGDDCMLWRWHKEDSRLGRCGLSDLFIVEDRFNWQVAEDVPHGAC